MSSLKPLEKKYIEDLLDVPSGYVLDYSNATFAELFRQTVGIEIYDEKYATNGGSKGKRLRAFWEIESDTFVGLVLNELLEVWKYGQRKKKLSDDTSEYAECLKIVNRIRGKKTVKAPQSKPVKEATEDSFLRQEFSKVDLTLLKLDPQFEVVIKQRIDEIEKSLKSEAALATIFLCGSTLEGLLLDVATKNPKGFNTSKSAQKDSEGKVRPLHEWTLNSLINVAHEQEFIGLDIKKHSHSLRDFRNYIHPRQQASERFNPDRHTAEISWQVLQGAIAGLSGKR